MNKQNRISVTAMLVFLIAASDQVLAQQPVANSNDSVKSASSLTRIDISSLQALWSRSVRKQFWVTPSGPHASAVHLQITPAASIATLPVLGGGTPGRLGRWLGSTSGNSILGDTTIFEDKSGNVGIGTDSPTSRLTVSGMVQSIAGGFKFPDGSVQITAGVSAGQVVRTVNLLSGDLTIVPGPNLTITPGGSTITIAAPGLLAGVAHDSTLSGTGTGSSPLGLPVPLSFTGSVAGFVGGPGLLNVTNNGSSGNAIEATGGLQFGEGIMATGFDAVHGIGVNLPGSFAGLFEGDVKVFGNLAVTENLNVTGTKNFKIDHPLDPQNKYLYHAAIESSEVLNIYSGNVLLDQNGEAVVKLPAWLEVVNKDFRYSLTAVGAPAPGLYVAEEVSGGRFKIAGGPSGLRVSWQLTGIRCDQMMKAHPFVVEQEKPESERGFYLQPELYGQPEEKGIEWARNPLRAQHMKGLREQAGEKAPPPRQ